MKTTTQPAPAAVKSVRRKTRKAAEPNLAQRVARLSASPQKELWRNINLKILTTKLRKGVVSIAPQQILALAMLVVAVSVVDRPTVETSALLNSRFHLSPVVFALVMVICGAIILVRPRCAAFMALTLPFVLFIVAGILYYTSTPNSSFTPPALYSALYLVILRVALKG